MCARRVEELSDGGLGVLAITHYSTLLTELRPDHVHVLMQGRIAASGGVELVAQIEREGYGAFGAVDEPPSPSSKALDDLFRI
jgi:Fe-S cluster assembly ATP-binding protein